KNHRVIYSLSNENKQHYFDDSSGDLNTKEAYQICDDKGLTNKYLHKLRLPVPLGKKFDKNVTISEILDYSNSLRFPLVVKPTDGLGGKGVMANIKNRIELKKAIKYVRETLKYEDIIVQEFIKGKEIRIYVIGEKVIGAVNRL